MLINEGKYLFLTKGFLYPCIVFSWIELIYNRNTTKKMVDREHKYFPQTG